MFRRNFSTRTWSRFQQFRKLLTASAEDQYITVKDSKKSMKFPQIWLRDNCRCSDCFHNNTQSRKFQFDLNVKANEVKAIDERIEIEWNDQHTSVFDLKWLNERKFCSKNQKKYTKEFYRLEQRLWSKDEYENILQTFKYNDVINSDDALRSWIETLAQNGVAMLENVPKEKGSVRKLSERIGFIKRTHYGDEFIVSAKPDAKNYAYLSSDLPLHTDMPFYDYKPGLNFLHCFTQSESIGGQSLVVDGFYAAERLRKEDPVSFEILKEVPVDWSDIGCEKNCEPFHCIFRMPVINSDCDGRYTRINHNIPQRDSHFTVKLEDVICWYEAYSKFLRILKEETYSFKLREGQLFTFNNLRLVHGRTGYDDNNVNIRYIIGAYMDWDIAYARLRLLKSDKRN